MSVRFVVVGGGTPSAEELAAIQAGLALIPAPDEVATTSGISVWEHTARREAVGLAGQAAGSRSSSSSAAWEASSGVA